MSKRTASWLAWGAWGVCILLILLALIISFLGGGHILKLLNNLFISIGFACFGTVGALIVSQRPKNTIGWIYCIVGIGTGVTDFSGAYSSYGAIKQPAHVSLWLNKIDHANLRKEEP